MIKLNTNFLPKEPLIVSSSDCENLRESFLNRWTSLFSSSEWRKPSVTPRTILFVDEDPILYLSTKRSPLLMRYNFSLACSWREAVASMKEERPALILLDPQINERNDLSLLTEFKNAFPRIPVVLITSTEAEESFIYEAIQKGASGVVSRKIDLENMLVTIRRVLAGQAIGKETVTL
jgi:two-component system, NtrC family, response regulator HydG